MEKDKRSMIIRFAIVYFIMVVLFVSAIAKLIHTQAYESKVWLQKSDSIQNANLKVAIKHKRGNIYSCDTQLLACNIPQYSLYVDFGSPRLHQLRDKDKSLFDAKIDSLSECLANEFKDKSKSEYKAYLLRGLATQNRYYPITTKEISYVKSKTIRTFPLFRGKIAENWLILDEKVKRIHPFGDLAESTIGDLYTTGDTKRGLEHSFDNILRGKDGKGHREDIAGKTINIIDTPAINGQHIITTIDIAIQDFADQALRKKLIELNAESGAVVLMETKTGRVRACVNLKRMANGTYGEIENIVVRYAIEPGSTFKVPAMMAALEDGKITPETLIDCGRGVWSLDGNTISDHNTGANANGVIPAREAIVRSSNVAMSKIIYNSYKDNPQQYVETLQKMGVGAPMDLDFTGGVAKASILAPDKRNVSKLAYMGIGYALEMPLLYTLAFFNAIANDGKMLQPYFVKNIGDNEEIPAKVIRERIASQETLDAIKKMMLGVIEGGEHRTGKAIKSDFVRIAGKTGTARYDYPANTKHQVSFCGFFPYEQPEYTGIVFIRNPQGAASGGSMAGPVFKEIAEKVVAYKSQVHIKTMPKNPAQTIMPQVKNGNHDATRIVLDQLKIKTLGEKHPKGWIRAQSDSATVTLSALNIVENLVPNVFGMGAKDAVYLLENAGLRVQITGRGKVVTQSIPHGTRVLKGSTIMLELK